MLFLLSNNVISLMKSFVYSICLLLCTFSADKAYAQGTYTGCYLSSTKTVYTSEPYSGYFLPVSGSRPLTAGYCSWTPTTGVSNCTVCLTSITQSCDGSGNCTFVSCNNPMPGIRNTFTMVACPIDDHVWVALVASIFIAVYIRQTRIVR